jgi:uncharacterized protein DUF417
MQYSSPVLDIRKIESVGKIERLGSIFLRYGLVIAIAWIAAMKVTEYEAKGIQPLIAHSPFLSWGYSVWSASFHDDHRRHRDHHRDVDCSSALVSKGFRCRKSGCGVYVLDYVVIHHHNSRLGTKPWRFSCAFR